MLITNRIALGSFIVVVMLTVACQSPSFAKGPSAGPELPGGPVQVSEEAAKRLDDKINQAFQQGPSSQFTLTATDEEVTSWAALRLAPQPDSHIEDPQIRFTQGKTFAAMTVTGILPFKLRINMVASVSIVGDQVQFKVEKSSAGIFPVPGMILDYLTQNINQTIMQAQLDVQVTSIDILESQILIAGKLR
jgi:hypothetical protein